MNWSLFIIAIIIGIILGLFIMMRRESKKAVVNLSEKEFIENMRKGQLVDLRKKEEFEEGHINGARNIPFVMLTRNPGRLRKDLPIYLYCEKGKVSKRAALVLYGKGYEQIYQLDGGLVNWNGPLKKTVKK
ncbi:rhodanese-like domain-containing protein [Turicibacter sp. TJ11]|uniref:rhodanese-like domain-containing protein n=1 Tax=Turicibacter sp. TJ11 TaxID=2806443 RepID=UPI001F37AF07|nr:rhodanese-like domain-containing protein [Turicibacter sp. TJ11]